MISHLEKRRLAQQKRGRVVYIVEVDGLPETNSRHAYRTEGIARAASSRVKGAKVVRYIPDPCSSP